MTIELYNKIIEFTNFVEYYILTEYSQQINYKNLHIFDILTECYCSETSVPDTARKILNFIKYQNDE